MEYKKPIIGEYYIDYEDGEIILILGEIPLNVFPYTYECKVIKRGIYDESPIINIKKYSIYTINNHFSSIKKEMVFWELL